MLAVLLVFTNVADSIAQSGMGIALIQRENASSRDYSTAFWMSLVVSLVLYGLLFACAPLVESLYSMGGLAAPLRLISLSFVINAANSIQRSYLQKSMDFKTLCKANILAISVSGAVGVAAAVVGLGIWALVLQYVMQAIVACLALLALCPWRPRFEFDLRSARELYSYGWKIGATGILGVLNTSISELILGKLCPASDLGFYSQGRKWPNAAISLFTNAVQNVFLPKFSELQHDRVGLQRSMKKMIIDGSLIVVPLACFAAVASESIVVLLLGKEWAACSTVFACACLSNIVVVMQVANLRAYMALGHSDLYLFLQLLKVVTGASVTALTALITGDINAVAIANLAVTVFNVVIIDLSPARLVHGFSRFEQVALLAPVLIDSLFAMYCASICAHIFNFDPLWELMVQLVVFSLVFIAMIRPLRVEGVKDLISAAVILKARADKNGNQSNRKDDIG